jgi:hypothetical protein
MTSPSFSKFSPADSQCERATDSAPEDVVSQEDIDDAYEGMAQAEHMMLNLATYGVITPPNGMRQAQPFDAPYVWPDENV